MDKVDDTILVLDFNTEEGKEFISEVEAVIDGIRSGDIPGEYFEF